MERNPEMQAGSRVRPKGGQRSEREETELKMGRQGEVRISPGRRDAG